jgi:hypothetical protein
MNEVLGGNERKLIELILTARSKNIQLRVGRQLMNSQIIIPRYISKLLSRPCTLPTRSGLIRLQVNVISLVQQNISEVHGTLA